MPPPETVQDHDERVSMHVHRPIQVSSGRGLDAATSLVQNGFALVNHPTRVRDFYDEKTIGAVFFRECVQLCKQLTGCHATRVWQFQYRNDASVKKTKPSRSVRARVDAYETLFHIDVTPYSELQLDVFANGRHFQIYNFWRSCSLDRNIETMPLALCDMQSVNPEELVFAEFFARREPPLRGYGYRVIHSASQRWYYFPGMAPGEVLVHKQYDTMPDRANLRGVLHGAIHDPTTRDGAPPRESIEVRILALFHEETDKLTRVRRFQSEIPAARVSS